MGDRDAALRWYLAILDAQANEDRLAMNQAISAYCNTSVGAPVCKFCGLYGRHYACEEIGALDWGLRL